MKEIPLTQGYVALVDNEDYDLLAAFDWYAQAHKHSIYAVRKGGTIQGKRPVIRMHCFLMGAKGIDHADTNGLNNQRYNLRPANKSQNACNMRKCAGKSSGYKGVSWFKRLNKWRVQVKINGKVTHVGYFREEFDAAQAYNFAAEEHYGEFARLNVPLVGAEA